MQGPYAAEQEYFRLNWLTFIDKDPVLSPSPSLSLHLTLDYLFSLHPYYLFL